MKTQTPLRLNHIILFLLFLFQFISKSHAQIIYTDIIPDSAIVANGSGYDLDINNDNTPDYNFSYTRITAIQGHCTGARTNYNLKVSPINATLSWIGNRNYGSNFPAVVPADTIINDTNYTWVNTNLENMVTVNWTCINAKGGYHWTSSTTGKWLSQTDKFLGLKFKVGANTYYGWVRLTVSSTTITIKDFAYNSAPDKLIFAGQTSTEFITTNTITGSPFCPGSNVDVGYVVFGNFDSTNIFTAQLSDSAGTFINPVSIGTLNSDSSGTIHAVIPPGTPYGLLYRIRVIASSPAAVANNNGLNLIVNSSTSTTHITVNGIPSICPGQFVYMYAPSSAGYTFQWRLNGVDINLATNFSYDATVIGYYSCLITNGCGTVLSDSVYISSTVAPVVSISSAGSLWVCPGESVLLSTDTVTGYTYVWYKNGTPIASSNQPTYNAVQPGVYRVFVQTANGCTGISVSDTVMMLDPLAGIAANGATTFCPGDSVVLSLIDDTDTSFTYQWYETGVTIPGETSTSYTATQTGSYTLIVTNPNGGCNTTSTAIDVSAVCAGVNEIISSSHFLISPNPANRFLIVDRQTKKEATIEIINHFGQIIYSDKINGLQKVIDLSKFSNGVYIIKWTEEIYSESKKFTLEK